MRRHLWGDYSPAVASIALLGLLADQGSKLWLLHGYDLAERGSTALAPFLDIVLVWNRGISYGLFQQDGDLGRWLLAGFTVLASLGIWIWSIKAENRLQASGLALILGGAIGNGIDRLAYGAVVDFVHFHIGTFSWYVFNLADAWIVAGVAVLLYDWAVTGPKNAAN
jgi:signal peptidase II